MISRVKYEEVINKIITYLKEHDIVLTETEKPNIEVADFCLNDIDNTRLQINTYVNTARVCAK